MNETDIAVMLESHKNEIGSLKHRMNKVEEQSEAINSLTLSVKELAINMGQMLTEQCKQGERLDKLEDAPAEQYSNMKRTIINTVIAVVAGAIATGFLYAVAPYLAR